MVLQATASEARLDSLRASDPLQGERALSEEETMISAFERKLNILVGIPSQGVWTEEFGMSLCNMMGHLMATPVVGYRNQRMQPMRIRSTILPRSRLKLVQAAFAQECTHLLFIDTDQRFPRDTAHRLLEWRKPVVACNIAVKQIPSAPTARAYSPDRIDGEPVYSDPGRTGLEEVWRIGAGIILVDMQVFRKTGARVFDTPWVEALQDYQGEDWSMCEAFRRAGYKIYIDHGLSREVGHIGSFDYTHDWCVDQITVKDQKIIGEA